jgi:ribosomal protein L11 methyltransferase
VRARLVELAPDGFEEVDLGGVVEFALYRDAAAEAAAKATLGGDVVSTPVEPGWEGRWRSFHRPVRAGGLWIGPPWEKAPPDEIAIVIDPGRAFGTGAHPTTRASLQLLAGASRGNLVDAGCGSGVLSVAAAKLGFDPVVAVDVDQIAVEATLDNAQRNGVSVEARRLDALADELPSADVVVANLELAAVEPLLTRLSSHAAIVSGYLASDRLRAPGWLRVARVQLSGWAADALVRGRTLPPRTGGSP